MGRTLRLAAATACLAAAMSPAKAHTLGIETFLGYGDIAYSGQVVYFDGAESRSGQLIRAAGLQAVRYNIGGVRYFGLLDDTAAEALVYADGELAERLAYNDDAIDTVAPQLAFHTLVNLRPLGQESVNGVETTHGVLTGFTRHGHPYAADIWLAPEGAVIRLRGTVLGTPIRYDLYGYRPGPQDASAFTLGPQDRP
ncbi:MAG: hypothetical protein RLO50_00775 [Azospirillaceae bacterium]